MNETRTSSAATHARGLDATALFDADTAVSPVTPDAYTATLTERWDRLGGGPLGGYSLAVALRALSDRFGGSAPAVASAFFLRPAGHGSATIETDVVRAGRRFSTGRAVLRQGERERVLVTATFGARDPDGRTVVLAHPPQLPPPGECVDPLDGMEIDGVTIGDRVEYRFPTMPGWRSGRGSGRPAGEFWMRLVGATEHRAHHLPLLVDAAAPMVLELDEYASSTLELTVHLRGEPAPGWLACRASTRFVSGGFHEEDFEIWDSSGALVAQSRQLAVLG